MKRRIEELMNGIYEYKTPDLLFSCDEIRAVVKPGEKFFGSFTIKNKEQKRIRGFLYSSDARVACEPREFSGIEPKLSFDVDFTGMKAGDVLEGSLTVCTNAPGRPRPPFFFCDHAEKGAASGRRGIYAGFFCTAGKGALRESVCDVLLQEFYKDDRKAVSAV